MKRHRFFSKRTWEIIKLVFKSFRTAEYSFNVYFSPPGTGKTTFAAYLANKYNKKNIPVYSNVQIQGTYKVETQTDIGKNLISNGVLLIDEAGLEYNNREFKTFPKEALRFFKYHRQYRVTVNLFSQGYNDMDLKLRTLATRYYVCKKSILPFLIHRSTYCKKLGVNDLTKDFCDCYFKVPFSGKWIFAPSLWLEFKSFNPPYLPEKEWDTW